MGTVITDEVRSILMEELKRSVKGFEAAFEARDYEDMLYFEGCIEEVKRIMKKLANKAATANTKAG